MKRSCIYVVKSFEKVKHLVSFVEVKTKNRTVIYVNYSLVNLIMIYQTLNVPDMTNAIIENSVNSICIPTCMPYFVIIYEKR